MAQPAQPVDEQVKQILLQQIKHNHEHFEMLMTFAHKVTTVLIAEAVSSTFYQTLIDIFGDGSEMMCRSIYAGFITIYAPTAAWIVDKILPSKGSSFLALSLQWHSKICPVLLAWGWKAWVVQLDVEAGTKVYDELAVAAVLTFVVVALQALPCFTRAKAAVAAGGDGDTILARIAVVPSGLALTLGYVWNMVASHPIGRLQRMHDRWEYNFMIQACYALIVLIISSIITVVLSHVDAKKPSKSASEVTEDDLRGGARHFVHDWSGVQQQSVKNILISSLSFIYAWSFLDTCDDWGFGVMFLCASYSSCSYQANFVYATSVTVILVAFAGLLHKFKHLTEKVGLTTVVNIQLNAMMLTVGWAWMNLYTVFMTVSTKRAVDTRTVVYIHVLMVICVLGCILNYVFQIPAQGVQKSQKLIFLLPRDDSAPMVTIYAWGQPNVLRNVASCTENEATMAHLAAQMELGKGDDGDVNRESDCSDVIRIS